MAATRASPHDRMVVGISEGVGYLLMAVGIVAVMVGIVRTVRAKGAGTYVPPLNRGHREQQEIMRKVREDDVGPADDLDALRHQAGVFYRQRFMFWGTGGMGVAWAGLALADPSWFAFALAGIYAAMVLVAVNSGRRDVLAGRRFLERHPADAQIGE